MGEGQGLQAAHMPNTATESQCSAHWGRTTLLNKVEAAPEYSSMLRWLWHACRPCIAAVAAFVVAQVLKLFTYWYSERRWDATRLIGSGGMPSSHTGCVSLCPPRLPICAHLYFCIRINDGCLFICLSFHPRVPRCHICATSRQLSRR